MNHFHITAPPSLNTKRDGYVHAFSGLREKARKMMPVATPHYCTGSDIGSPKYAEKSWAPV